jgi:hypothetical protein
MKTTLHTVLCIVIRVSAVLMLVGIVEQVPTIFMYASQGRYSVGALWLAGAGVLLAVGLWLWPNVLAWWAISRSQHEMLESPIGADQIQRVAFSIIGVWLFIGGATGLLSRAIMMLIVFRHAAYGDSTRVLTSTDWYWLMDHGATAAAGAGLAVGSRSLVGLLRRLRDYPHVATANADPDTATTQDG